MRPEIDGVFAAQSEESAMERSPDGVELAVPADGAGARDPDLVPVRGVAPRDQGDRITARTGPIGASRWPFAQAGMRPRVIVMPAPADEPLHLGARRRRRRLGCRRLEHAVHLLVGGVVLRPGAAGKARFDPQAQPPDTKTGPAVWSQAAPRGPAI